MAEKITGINVEGRVYEFLSGQGVKGACTAPASSWTKPIVLPEGAVFLDGLIMAITFVNGNSVGFSGTKTIYSSDGENFYYDPAKTDPVTFPPVDNYTLEHTSGEEYSFSAFPTIVYGNYTLPVRDAKGHITGGEIWSTGDTVICMFMDNMFLMLSAVVSNAVASGDMNPVTSNAVANVLSDYFSKTSIQIHNKDLNDITDVGFYFSNGTDNLQNKPLNSAYNNIILVLEQGNAGRYEQIFYSINENTYWYRYYSGSWSAWQKIIKDTDIVDSVTSGSMQPVTSNAVNSALSVKLPVLLFNWANNTGNMKYYKANDIFPRVYGEVVYFMQARAGELIVISAGHGDGDAYATPKAKRLLNTYSKIAGLRYSGSVLYFALSAYSHEVILTKMSGNWDLTRTSSPAIEVSQSEYNAATAITIET